MNMTRTPTQRTKDIKSIISVAGRKFWADRLVALQAKVGAGARYGKLVAKRYAAEFAAEKCRLGREMSPLETSLASRVAGLSALDARLNAAGKVRFRAALTAALTGEATLIPLLHLHRTAILHEAAGFEVQFAGFEDGAPFDLLITRDGVTAEIACDTLSAEEGRLVHQSAWMRLMDRIDPDLQTWLSAHPGRYLLKMTLPQGLRDAAAADGTNALAALHERINTMLSTAKRSDHDEAAVLRLDPLMLAAAQAGENGLMNKLRREFGPEANLAVTGAGNGIFVLAARAGSENEIAVAMRKRLAALAPARLTGTRPGILAMFIEDTDRLEWTLLRDHLTLEGEARQFLTFPEARIVVAVTCASRFELYAEIGADSAMRFRNPSHPAAKLPALAPAILSTM
ncbi:hypothetical protein AruPA_00030 [Acidiphilium sp. PA]|uniref:hypothetical protein n=1 Tax=Acidiphilium sp. PA TaxID=2871705 RepID=UPI002244A78A|nr:hypothetical protein [Acidiphilium sp. PA]MCW8305408.1 hypothetical protein [Acidiphilium sp. PA]